MANFSGEPLDRTRDHCKRHKIGGMAVARNDLTRNRLDLQAQRMRDVRFDLRGDVGERPDRAGYGADRDFLACSNETRARTSKLRVITCELETESRGFRVNAMAAADRDRVLVFE